MKSGVAKKRKSSEGRNSSASRSNSKKSAWYEQEMQQQQGSEKEQRPRRFSLFGGLLSKMKSSSKLSSSSSSLNRLQATAAANSSESSFQSSEKSTSSYDSAHFKQNENLHNFIHGGGHAKEDEAGAPANMTNVSSDSSSSNYPSSASCCTTPVSSLMRGADDLRHSTRSMPVHTPNRDVQNVISNVRRVHSVSDSPSTWLRRKSLRLRGRRPEQDSEMEQVKEEDGDEDMEVGYAGEEAAEGPDPVICTASIDNDRPISGQLATTPAPPSATFVAPTPRTIDRSRSAAASLSKKKSLLVRRHNESPYDISERTETTADCQTITPTSVATLPPGLPLSTSGKLKKLTPSSTSSSKLQKIGAVLKRGFSSGSRMRTPVSSGGPAAMVTVARRPTMGNSSSRRLRSDDRRMSDVTGAGCFGDESFIIPKGDESGRKFNFHSDYTESFVETVETISWTDETDPLSLLAAHSFDAVVVDAKPDGTPVSSFSDAFITHFELQEELSEAVKSTHKNGIIKVDENIRATQCPSYVIYIVVKESDVAKQIRIGYEAALTFAFQNDAIHSLLLPQLFCNNENMTADPALADSIVLTVYRAFGLLSGRCGVKLSEISLTGASAECTALLKEHLGQLIQEKQLSSSRPRLSQASNISFSTR